MSKAGAEEAVIYADIGEEKQKSARLCESHLQLCNL